MPRLGVIPKLSAHFISDQFCAGIFSLALTYRYVYIRQWCFGQLYFQAACLAYKTGSSTKLTEERALDSSVYEKPIGDAFE